VLNMNKNYKNVTIRKSTHEMAQYISKITERSIASFINELVESVFNIALNFEQANLEFETRVSDSTVCVNVVGRKS